MTEREKMKLEFGMTDEEYNEIVRKIMARVFWESDNTDSDTDEINKID